MHNYLKKFEDNIHHFFLTTSLIAIVILFILSLYPEGKSSEFNLIIFYLLILCHYRLYY